MSNTIQASHNTTNRTIENADLLTHNTMRLACSADQLITLTNEQDVETTVSKLHTLNQPMFVLSGGSNVLLPTHLHATVLHPMLKGIEVLSETAKQISIEVMAGEVWHDLVVSTVSNGWFGLENLALIPGLTGAAPVQNIGAYGVQLDDYLTHLKAFHLPTQTWHTFNKAECDFGYRDSKFKREAGQWLITRVGFCLHKIANKVQANYGDVAKLATSISQERNIDPTQQELTPVQVTPVDVMHAIINIRQSKLPDPNVLPNCGSFFKNPVISTQQFVELKQTNPNIVGYKVDDTHTKVAAGWLIDTAGLKGQGVLPILTHTKQALVLVNQTSPNSTNQQATQADVLATQQHIQRTIKNTFGIQLEREPVWVDSVANYK